MLCIEHTTTMGKREIGKYEREWSRAKEGCEWKSDGMTREWKGEGGKGEREGRGCGWESESEGGVRIKAQAANNRGRRMEEGKQGKEGVGMNGYRVGTNGGVGRGEVVGKKGIKGRSGKKEMRQRNGRCRTSKGGI